jgi:signal transduction histidine kinase
MRKSKPPPGFPKHSSEHPKATITAPKASSVPRIPLARSVPSLRGDDEDGGQTTATRNFRPSELDEDESISGITITVLAGPEEGKVHPLRQGETWIGRGSDCDVVVDDAGLSRRHACFVVRQGGVTLRDNRAKNGTFVEGVRIKEHELRPGDEIQLGANVTLLFSQVGKGSVQAGSDRKSAESVASVVAGIAHEINTPLGVAQTANALIQALSEEVEKNPTGDRVHELLKDLRASAGLVTKNLERTNQLVRLFKQLSFREGSDERAPCDLRTIVTECVDALSAESSRRGVLIRAYWPDEGDFTWVGSHASMTMVLTHLLQNTLRYGYPATGGDVDVRLSAPTGRYHLEVEDYGIGVAPHLLSRIFEPFVTSGRESGATGLGLAVVRNIVTNLFGGTIKCNSRVGKGTRFVISIPRAAPTLNVEIE